MKIVYVTNGFPPRQTAGTETYTAGVALEMLSRGHTVTVVCAGDWDTGPRPVNQVEVEDYQGVTVIRVDLNWTRGSDPNLSLYYNAEIEELLKKLLGEDPPDLVHVTSCYTLSSSVLRAIKSLNYPLILTLTDFWFICPRVSLLRSNGQLCDGRTSPWTCLNCSLVDSNLYQKMSPRVPQSWVEPLFSSVSRHPVLSRQRGFRGLALDMRQRKEILREMLNLADFVIAPSKFLADMFIHNGILAPIRVIGYGLDVAWRSRVIHKSRAKPLVFGYIGRITYSKGVHIFTAALAHLEKLSQLEGRVWGDVQQEPEYASQLNATYTPATRLNFCGKFDRFQIAEVYSQIDVLVVPSIWYENNPLVIQEAFAAGVPVIASNLGGMAEFVEDGRNGLLFEAGNVEALAAAMRRVIDESDLLGCLQKGIPEVRTVSEEADTLLEIYSTPRLESQRI
jgi:glycosyltransferase involved in cell wall biosynthesis